MTAGVFASVDAPPLGLWEGLTQIFNAFERMSEQDQELAYRYLFDPEMRPERHLEVVR